MIKNIIIGYDNCFSGTDDFAPRVYLYIIIIVNIIVEVTSRSGDDDFDDDE